MFSLRQRRRARFVAAAALCAALASAAIVVPATSASAATVSDAWTDKARYAPGQQAVITAQVSGTGPVTFSLVHLGSVVDSTTVQASGSGSVTWSVTPPSQDFTGYMVHVDAGSTSTETAIDVSSDWTRFPRTGYLDTYSSSLTTTQQQAAVNDLARKYHLNSLQFYDWMWRHEKPIQRNSSGNVVSTWTAWNGDVIAPTTVSGLISASHSANVAALPYSMSYAALEGFAANGVNSDWRLKYRSNGSDWKFQMLPNEPATTLWIMNPANSGWKTHMTGQYADQINTLGFDGTHIDQLGNWGSASDGGMNDISGNAVDLPQSFADLVGATKSQTAKTVGFNAVDGFGADALAGSASDYLYTELWDNHETYASVQSYLDSQRAASGGKGAVIAAYLNYKSNPGTRSEAETGTTRVGVTTNTDHTGYTGTGFVDGFGDTGDSITFTVSAPESRRYGVVPTWSAATSSTATRTVTVDGVNIGKLKLPSTPNWNTWSSEAGLPTYLSAGSHTIKISVEASDSGFVNFDSLTLGSFNTPSVQLADAALAANGASHIEMGQDNQMLVAPYFPDHSKQMDLTLQSWMESYYDVITGYENLFYGPTLKKIANQISITGQTTSTTGEADKIWTNVMSNNGVDVIHLINLKGNDSNWREPAATAPTLTNLPVKYYLGNKPVPPSINVASPDRNGGRSTSLAFTSGTDAGGTYVTFSVPELKNWDFVYMGTSSRGNGNIVGKGGKCLEVAGGNTANGTAIQLGDCASVAAQNWTFQNNKLGVLGKCLDLVTGGTANGTLAHLWDCHSGASQTWQRTSQSQFRNPVSGKCLDLVGGATANGTRAHLWDCHSGSSQKWTVPQ